MKNFKNGFIARLIVVVGAILTAGGAYAFFGNNNASGIGGGAGIVPSNTLPMYGYASYESYLLNRSEEQAKGDDTFVSDVLTKEPNKVDASSYATLKGFEAFQKGDLETAIGRFNQGWLIDHNNQNAYWGFAVYSGTRDGSESALKYFDIALEKFDQKYVGDDTDRDRLSCDTAVGYNTAYIYGGRKNSKYSDKANAILSKVGISNATPLCAKLIAQNSSD